MEAELNALSKFASVEISKVSNPTNHINPKNPPSFAGLWRTSSDSEEAELNALSKFASVEISKVFNPTNHINPKNPSSDNMKAELNALSKFASDVVPKDRSRPVTTKTYWGEGNL